MELNETLCPHCKSAVTLDAYFCPRCGKALRPAPQSVSVGKQIVIYAVSALLPPLGLWYAWKYYKQGDPLSKKIALAATILTVISTIISFWLFDVVINSFNQALNSALGGVY